MKKVSVLGAGSWGTALALVLARNGNEVSLWTIKESQRDEINKNKTNRESHIFKLKNKCSLLTKKSI